MREFYNMLIIYLKKFFLIKKGDFGDGLRVLLKQLSCKWVVCVIVFLNQKEWKCFKFILQKKFIGILGLGLGIFKVCSELDFKQYGVSYQVVFFD